MVMKPNVRTEIISEAIWALRVAWLDCREAFDDAFEHPALAKFAKVHRRLFDRLASVALYDEHEDHVHELGEAVSMVDDDSCWCADGFNIDLHKRLDYWRRSKWRPAQ
jgi:hypothetical protein